MGKNRNKHRPQQPIKASPPAMVPAAPDVGTAPPPLATVPATQEAAVAAIPDLHARAYAAATSDDLEAAMDAPLASGPSDLVAVAAQVREALALCESRTKRLDDRTSRLGERELAINEREAGLVERVAALAAESERLQIEDGALKERQRRVEAEEAEQLARQADLRTRELNAEAGFIAERRQSLGRFETEAATVRAELARAREAIATERADWDARWRTDDLRRHDEQRALLVAHRDALAAERRAWNEEKQEEEAKLARVRSELKKDLATLEGDREDLQENRAAFDLRVERKAAARLEDARATREDLEARLQSARDGRETLYKKVLAHEEAQRILGNRPLEEVKRELDDLTRDRDQLKADLEARPGNSVLAKLQELERAREEWENDRPRLTQELMSSKTSLARSAIAVTELETLRDQKAALESGRDLLHAALDELRKDVNERIRRADGASPFPSCSQMDVDPALQTRPPLADEPPNLAELCRELQHRIAIDPDTDKILYYSSEDIRCFLAGLAMSRLHLLHGISGTGKTSLPLAFARAIGARAELVEVQAGWRDRQDLIGHFNAFERRFYEAEFLQSLYRAQCPRYAGVPVLVVLDEMNLSHPEQYFADLLSALEQDWHRQKLDLMTAAVDPTPTLLLNGRTLKIPSNVWFVGTANHDETTKDFADKTYDRAHVMELPRHRETFTPERKQPRTPLGVDALNRAFAAAQKQYEKEAKEAYRFLDQHFADVLAKRFRVGWGNRLERQMLKFVPVVIAAGGSVGEAIDHILATKLLRKVRDRHDTQLDDVTALQTSLTGAWKQLASKTAARRSEEIIRNELRRLGAEEAP